MSEPVTRYRMEGAHACIDIVLHSVPHLFDGRDPAPFRDRDLDDDAAEYMFDSAVDIPREHPLKLVLVVEQGLDPSLGAAEIASAVRTHFQYEVDRVNRQLRLQRRFGRAALAAGLSALTVLLILAEVARAQLRKPWAEIIHTGFVILAWVVLWKPVDVLLYDWWPLAQRRTDLLRLVAAEVEVRRPEA